MANDINTRQNDEHILKCLVAQRRLYSTAKKWDYVPQSLTIKHSGHLVILEWALWKPC